MLFLYSIRHAFNVLTQYISTFWQTPSSGFIAYTLKFQIWYFQFVLLKKEYKKQNIFDSHECNRTSVCRKQLSYKN